VRVALILAIVAATASAEEPKAEKKPATPAAQKAPPKPVSPTTQAILDRIAKGDKAAVGELVKIAPTVIDELGTFLTRTHTSTVEERRAVLMSFKADVPDKKGRFVVPDRDAKATKAAEALDWVAELQKLDPATPGAGEVLADIAAIRALSSTKTTRAAQIMFDVAFPEETMMYRDEVGRYLRKMEPYCIPALMKESQSRNYDRKRYSNYQLERLDDQEPGKALSAANADENLTIEILETWRKTKHREAVHTVWSKVNADSARIRAKARETWMGYIEGPPPPPAPMKKLQMTGGKLTKKEKPLWLTYRELADNELRRVSNELLGTDYPIVDPTLDDSDEFKKPKIVKIDIVGVTKELFAYYDKLRAEQEAKQWAEAEAKSKTDVATAAMMLDRLLAANPDHGNRAQMAPIYLAYAKQLEAKAKWADAAAAYSKAHGVAPTGPHATEALAAHHYTLGKALEAQGKDGGPDYRKAVALRPDYASAKEAAARTDTAKRPRWLLYTALIAVMLALGAFAAAMVRRRA